MHMYIHICMMYDMCTYLSIYVRMHACMYVYVCTDVYICMCMCMYVCMYVCMHACMYPYMYIYIGFLGSENTNLRQKECFEPKGQRRAFVGTAKGC